MRHLLSTKLALATIGLLALAPSQVQAQTNSVSVPYNAVVFNPCSGNLVVLSGTLNFRTHVTVDANGGVHNKFQFQLRNVKGMDLTTGDKYVGTGVTQQTQNITSGAGNVTFVNITNLIGQGKAPNMILTQEVHATVNANGVVTANVVHSSLSCH